VAAERCCCGRRDRDSTGRLPAPAAGDALLFQTGDLTFDTARTIAHNLYASDGLAAADEACASSWPYRRRSLMLVVEASVWATPHSLAEGATRDRAAPIWRLAATRLPCHDRKRDRQ